MYYLSMYQEGGKNPAPDYSLNFSAVFSAV